MALSKILSSSFYPGSIESALVSPLGLRNRFINGDISIDQRLNGAQGTATNAYVSADRWYSTTGYGTAYIQKVSDAPAGSGFNYSLKFTGPSSGGTLPNLNWTTIQQLVEGYNISDFMWGSSYARTAVVSFWVKASIAGQYSFSIMNGSSNVLDSSTTTRSYVTTYTVNSANTWEYKTLVIPGCTDGSWNITNGIGLIAYWNLGSGSNYTTATTNAWQNGKFVQTSTSTSLVASGVTSPTFQVTGLQLEPGLVATPFERRSYANEFTLAQRYFIRHRWSTNINKVGCGTVFATNGADMCVPAVPMRTDPTCTYSSGLGVWDAGAIVYPTSVNGVATYGSMITLDMTTGSGLTTGRSCMFRLNASGDYLDFNAEL